MSTGVNNLKIAIFVGDHPYSWDHSSLYSENGMVGGTEECVIHVSKRLAMMGCKVYIFNEPLEHNKSFNFNTSSVTYRHFGSFKINQKWDHIIVLQGSLDIIDKEFKDIKVSAWLHDFISDKISNQYINKYLVLSKSHKNNVISKGINKKKVVIVENGVDTNWIEGIKSTEKNQYYCINTSDPNRGLYCLVKDIWPRIKSKVPQATLHWFYGWGGFDWYARENEELMKWKQDLINLIEETDGVFSHGRVSQKEIIKKYKKASIWLYPTEFQESYCISAIKSQYCKSLPITTSVGALEENVQFGEKIDCNDIYENRKAQEEIIGCTVDYLKNENKRKDSLKGSKNWVIQNKEWDETINRFVKLLKSF